MSTTRINTVQNQPWCIAVEHDGKVWIYLYDCKRDAVADLDEIGYSDCNREVMRTKKAGERYPDCVVAN
jgi:gamma-glutamylcyclotransferase (GGCT)/AIG2-like uncharacterized protein YtfP